MSGYLTRLVAPRPETAPEVLPFVRSRSPVAEQDQRAGIPGFEDAAFATPEPVGRQLNPHPVAYDRALSPSLVGGPDATVPVGTTGKAQSGPAAAESRLERRARLVEPVGDPAGTRGVIARSQPVPEIDPAPSAHNRSLRQTLASATDASPQVDSSSPAEEPAASGERRHVMVRREARPAPGGETDAAVDGRRHVPTIPRTATPSLEPVVHKPHQPERMPPGADAPRDKGDPLPRVFIGRINVEVVAQKAGPGSHAVSRPLPAVAESVSVIGPLGKGMPANRRISLRHR